MADTKISDLTALTTIADADLLEVVDASDTTMSASGTNKKIEFGTLREALTLTLATEVTASFTAVVGTITPVDLSGAGADVVMTWPASLAAGDEFGVIITATNASYELTHSRNSHTFRGGTDVDALPIWQVGELLIFKYIDGTVHLLRDGRRLCHGYASLSADASSVYATGTFTRIVLDTEDEDVGGLFDTTNDYIIRRRKCGFHVAVCTGIGSMGDGTRAVIRVMSNGANKGRNQTAYAAVASGVARVQSGMPVETDVAGTTVYGEIFHDVGSTLGAVAGATFMSWVEVLA